MQGRKSISYLARHKWMIIMILVVALVGLDLLTNNASIVNRGIVVGLAIDSSGDLLELNAQVILPRSGGSAAGGNDFMIFSSSGETMQDAIERLSASMGVKASMAHCTLVVLGEDLLKTKCDPVLKFMIKSDVFADNTLLVAASGKAKEVLAANVPINDVAAYHLQRMMQGVQREAGVNSCTVKDYFTNYHYIGGAGYMPIAVIEDCEYSPSGATKTSPEGQKTQLLNLSRSLVTTREGYAFILDQDASKGLSYVYGKLNGGTIIYVSDCSAERDVIILESECRIKVLSPQAARADVKVHIKRNEMQSTDEGKIVNALSKREKERICGSVKGQVYACFEECRKEDVDIFHLGEKMYRKYGKEWLKGKNKLYIRDIDLEINVELQIK